MSDRELSPRARFIQHLYRTGRTEAAHEEALVYLRELRATYEGRALTILERLIVAQQEWDEYEFLHLMEELAGLLHEVREAQEAGEHVEIDPSSYRSLFAEYHLEELLDEE